MFLAGLGLCIDEVHGHERLRGRVAVLQILKDGAAEPVLALLRHVGQEQAVTLDDEAGQSAFQVRFGLPAQFVAADSQVSRCGRRCGVGHRGVFDVLHPTSRDRLAREPCRLQRITGDLRGGDRFEAGWTGQPCTIRRHGIERITAGFRQSSTQARIKPWDGEVALIATLVRRQWIDGHADESTFTTHLAEKHLIRGPHADEATILNRHAFFRSRIAHHGHLQRGVRQGVSLDRGTFRVRFQ